MAHYVHKTYPISKGCVMETDGTVRAMTPEELAPLNESFKRSVEREFIEPLRRAGHTVEEG